MDNRLPSVSASQALRNSSCSASKPLPTGLDRLDSILQDATGLQDGRGSQAGGLSRGQVTEIYGPPGVGKSTLGMQICANALRAGEAVVWVDTSFALPGPRLQEILTAAINPSLKASQPSQLLDQSLQDLLDNFHHFNAPTLSHILALLLHPAPSFPPMKTGLIVVDAISTLFGSEFPRLTGEGGRGCKDNETLLKRKNDHSQWLSSRKWAVIGDFISKIGRLAAVRDVAILLISQTKMKVQTGAGAVLLSSISSSVWDVNIANQIFLFRDNPPQTRDGEGEEKALNSGKLRFAGVLRSRGVVSSDGVLGRVVPFVIEEKGIRGVEIAMPSPDVNQLPAMPVILKRKHDEITNSGSEDDEYGWDSDDEIPAEDDPTDVFGEPK
ncbi:hypothetical protein FGG08_006966 [Glutinoglossum americanum]|uniref:RecA family profile 1 domain-containing protein n=1 Tax=Glutinoglossum americanum TaxID=1670608 RepID=A0A9P8I6A8_9PEZI|nr:hypothetical protein FGG08_006966 [Glutinoglossum americanum]